MNTSNNMPSANTEDQLRLIDHLLDALRNDLSSDIERVVPEEYRAGIRAKLTERIATLRDDPERWRERRHGAETNS